MTEFDPTKPVQTRGGGSARILCTDAKKDYPIVALITSCEGDKCARTYTLKGEYMAGHTNNSNDLINIPEKRFVNIWERDGRCCVSYTPHATAEEAREATKKGSTYPSIKYIAVAVEVDA